MFEEPATEAVRDNVLSDETPSDEILRLFAQEAAQVPENLRSSYLEEVKTIAADTQARIKRILHAREVSVVDEVKADVQRWVDLKPKKDAYERYHRYMEKHSKKPPYTFEMFKNKHYEDWQKIEIRGLLRPNTLVHFGGEIYIVVAINRDCKVRIRKQNQDQEHEQEQKRGQDRNITQKCLKVVIIKQNPKSLEIRRNTC